MLVFIVMQMNRVNREKGYSVAFFSSILNQIAEILKFMHFISILAWYLINIRSFVTF